jgi:hypothetical protein
LNPSLTIVLPVHNGESRLRRCVGEILELASELTPKFQVLIVDDGSTDDTFAAAEELSARYPQISVRRNRQQRGLGQTIETVGRRIQSDVVIVHDGVSPIDANEVRMLWRAHFAPQSAAESNTPTTRRTDAAILAEVAQTHAAIARAHGRLLGFQLLTSPHGDSAAAIEQFAPASGAPRPDAPHTRRRTGVGQIPPLPRPKFLAAITNFALGE